MFIFVQHKRVTFWAILPSRYFFNFNGQDFILKTAVFISCFGTHMAAHGKLILGLTAYFKFISQILCHWPTNEAAS